MKCGKKSTKTYVCVPCGAEVEVLGEGKSRLYCCGKPMKLKKSQGSKKK